MPPSISPPPPRYRTLAWSTVSCTQLGGPHGTVLLSSCTVRTGPHAVISYTLLFLDISNHFTPVMPLGDSAACSISYRFRFHRRPGGVSGYPSVFVSSSPAECILEYKFFGTFSRAQIDLRKARERELATLDEKLTSSGIAEHYNMRDKI